MRNAWSWMIVCALAIATPFLSACSGDNDEERKENTNANNAQVFPEYARMEMPRIKDGSRIIIHRTKAFGVNYIVEWDGALASGGVIIKAGDNE